jgi:hypothetical protein
MKEKNCSPPIQEWTCPICCQEINLYNGKEERTQWDVQFNLEHDIDSVIFENIYPFFMYGEAQLHFAIFMENKYLKPQL